MAPPGDDSWLHFADPRFGFEFDYPPAGREEAKVTILEQERSDRRRVHIATDDDRDVYFELERIDRRTVDEGVAELRGDLLPRFPDAAFEELTPADLCSQPARMVRFHFGVKVRWAIFTEQAAPAHRVILDPRSPTNHAILATLTARG